MRCKVISLSVFGAAAVLVATPCAAQDLNWSPATSDELRATIIASADAENEPIFGLTIGSGDFDQEIGDGFVSYLSLDRPAMNIEGGPEGLREAFTRSEFLRDQVVKVGDAEAGTQREATYRSVQMAHIVDCSQRTIADNGYTLFLRNETEGSAQHFVEGSQVYSQLKMSRPGEESMNEGLVQAVCDGAYLYEPQ